MSTLVAITFPGEGDAKTALGSVRALEHEGGIGIEDTAVVNKDADGKIHVKNEMSSGTETGAAVGAMLGLPSTVGAACGSDAFFPFPDAIEACLSAGVTAIAQPGGSRNDQEAIGVVDAAGATMLITGTRHFRH